MPKSPDTIQQEKERIAANVEPVYKISDTIKFNTISRIDSFIEHLAAIERQPDPETARRSLQDRGYNLSLESIEKLSKSRARIELHNYLINIFNSNLSVGVYDESFIEERALLSTNDSYREIPLRNLFSIDESRERVVNNINNPELQPIVEETVHHFLTPNIVIDTEKTELLIQEAYNTIVPVLTEVLENEEIIRRNRRITEIDLKKLEAMYSLMEDEESTEDIFGLIWYPIIGYFLLSFVLTLAGYFSFVIIIRNRFDKLIHVLTYLSLLLLLILMTYGLAMFDTVPDIILPFALPVILFALLFNPPSGFIVNCIGLFLVLPFLHWNISALSVLFLATMLLLIIMTRLKDNHDFLVLSISCLVSFFVVAITVSLLIQNVHVVDFLFYGALSCIISMAGIIIISPVLEKNLNLTNKIILLQLQDNNNPLLKRMSVEAPGTYNHSIMVGNLAESAAVAIGANALLAKVGGLYHDIGKLTEPEMFVENNTKAPELHNQKDSYDSTVTIRNHVLSGITLAKKYKLPQQVIDIIRQHHGISKVSFFYQKAKKTDPDVDEKKFRYFGPKPRTKEAVLVMIADIVESTAKSISDQHDEESLKKIIDDTIEKIINDKQLSEAPITLKELETIKSFMLPIIVGIYQKRVEYPKEKSNSI